MRRLLALVVLCGVAGCSGPGPRTADVPPARVSASPAARPSPSPAPAPRFPATKEGALAIGRAFFTELGRANVDGDTAALRALAMPGCPCLKAAEQIEQTRAQGSRFTGADFTILSVSDPVVTGHSGNVTVTYDVAPGALVTSTGKRTTYSGYAKEINALTLDAVDGVWRVEDATELVKGKPVEG